MTANGPLFLDYQPIPNAPEGAHMSRWTDYTEPTRIRATALAVVQLAAALGIVLPFDLPGLAEAVIVALAALLPLVTGEAIRSKVTPAAKHVVVPQTPGRPDHAA